MLGNAGRLLSSSVFLRVLLQEQSWHELRLPQGGVRARSAGTAAWQLSHVGTNTSSHTVSSSASPTAKHRAYWHTHSCLFREAENQGCVRTSCGLTLCRHVTSIPHPPRGNEWLSCVSPPRHPVCFYLLAPCVYFCLQLSCNYVYLSVHSFIHLFIQQTPLEPDWMPDS